jgi:tetratricopeptide (TPR) repeat protein
VAAAFSENPPGATRAGLLANEAARLQFAGDSDSARGIAEQALGTAEESGDDSARGVAALTLASALRSIGKLEEATSTANRALEAYQRAQHPLGIARARTLLASLAHAGGRLEEAERLYDEALVAARGGSLRLAIEELLMSRAAVLVELGRWSLAREAAAEALRNALEDGRALGAAVAMTNLAQIEGLMGDVRPARRHARAAVRLARRHVRSLEGLAWRSLAQVCRITGDLPGAFRAARRALSRACPTRSEEQWRRLELGRSLAARGRWSEIPTLVDPGDAGRPPDSSGAAALDLLAARAALRRGDLAPAGARLAAVEVWMGDRAALFARAGRPSARRAGARAGAIGRGRRGRPARAGGVRRAPGTRRSRGHGARIRAPRHVLRPRVAGSDRGLARGIVGDLRAARRRPGAGAGPGAHGAVATANRPGRRGGAA